MSRIYQDSALANKAVHSARLPGTWNPAEHQGGNGVLVEGELVDVSRHSIMDANGKKERYYVLYLRPAASTAEGLTLRGKKLSPTSAPPGR